VARAIPGALQLSAHPHDAAHDGRNVPNAALSRVVAGLKDEGWRSNREHGVTHDRYPKNVVLPKSDINKQNDAIGLTQMSSCVFRGLLT